MQQQVNRLQEEVLTAANANAYLEEIRVQQHDHINKLLNSEKMKTKQMTLELDAERLGKKDALQQHVTEQTKKRLSGGDKEQNAVPLPAALPPNKKQKQNVPGKACDADSLIAQHAGLCRQGNEAAVVQGMLTHSEHAGMQEQACAALRNLAFNDVKSSKTAEAGGIEAVVAGMEAHKASVLVQQEACWAVSSLAVHAGNKVRIAEAGHRSCCICHEGAQGQRTRAATSVLGAEQLCIERPQPGQDSRGRWHQNCCICHEGAQDKRTRAGTCVCGAEEPCNQR
jgi:hypothetical protein